jgi:hypothetical protein
VVSNACLSVASLARVVSAKSGFGDNLVGIFTDSLLGVVLNKKKAVVRREPPLCRSRLKNLALEEGG